MQGEKCNGCSFFCKEQETRTGVASVWGIALWGNIVVSLSLKPFARGELSEVFRLFGSSALLGFHFSYSIKTGRFSRSRVRKYSLFCCFYPCWISFWLLVVFILFCRMVLKDFCDKLKLDLWFVLQIHSLKILCISSRSLGVFISLLSSFQRSDVIHKIPEAHFLSP